MLKNIINFIKYHNLFTLSIVVVFVSGGTAFAASPQLREATGDALIGRTETVISIDNTALLNTNFDNFDPGLVITAVSEDEDSYYVSYTFNTFAVLDGAWGSAIKDGELTVPKDSLNSTDLRAYVEEELKEVAQAEVTYLKEVKTRELRKGETEKTTVVAYTGLLGLVIDTKEKEITYETVNVPTPTPTPTPEPTPEPTLEPTPTPTPEPTPEPEPTVEPAVDLATSTPSTETTTATATTTPDSPAGESGVPASSADGQATTTPSSESIDETSPNAVATDTVAPVITLTGTTTPSLLVGDTFTDEGGTAYDDTDGDITASITVAGDTVDTTIAGTYTVTYDVADTAGNSAMQITRIVTVEEPPTTAEEDTTDPTTTENTSSSTPQTQ